MLELLRERPNWLGALSVALTRPPGVPERRHGEDPWALARASGPRRITDDLAWLRQALDDPEPNGLRPVAATDPTAAWEPDAAGQAKLRRLSDRHVLEAAGFELTERARLSSRALTPRFERPAPERPLRRG